MHYPDLLGSDCYLIGKDQDGKVSQIDPVAFSDKEAAVIGYIDTPT